MRTMMKFFLAVLIIATAFTADASGNKKEQVIPATEFVIVYSVEVEYNGLCEFSLDQFRKENRVSFSPWNKEINDENFRSKIMPGEKATICIVVEKNGKMFTADEAERFIASQNAKKSNFAWLMLAQVKYGINVWLKANTICFTEEVVPHKSGAKLIPYLTINGGAQLTAREYPLNTGKFVDQFAYIK